RLVRLIVTQEGPDLAIAVVHQTTAGQILHHVRLVDRSNGTQTHGNRGELPVIRHQPGVGVGGQTVAIDLLTEVVELLLGETPFEEGAGVDTGRRVSLEVDEVSTMVFTGAAEEVVEPDVVEGCGRGESGDVAAEVGTGLLACAHHHGQRVPADDAANLTFHVHIARHSLLFASRNGVAIGGGYRRIGKCQRVAGGFLG